MTTSQRQAVIAEMVRRIVAQFRPDRIILFGSFARGEATRDSDVDLLVVKAVQGSKRQERLAIRAALRGCGLPKDILVATPDEVRRYQSVAGSLVHSALREGRVLYDAAA